MMGIFLNLLSELRDQLHQKQREKICNLIQKSQNRLFGHTMFDFGGSDIYYVPTQSNIVCPKGHFEIIEKN